MEDICSNLIPGAEHVTHGINLFYFSMNETDNAPTTAPWTTLSCPAGRQRIDRGYDLPLEFESQYAFPAVSHIKQDSIFLIKLII